MVVRNIQVKLDVPEAAHSVLDETFEQFRYAAQAVADYGWADDPTEIVTGQGDLNAATYDQVREDTELHSNHVQSARSLAANALSNCQDRIFDGERASRPAFRGTVVVYGQRTITDLQYLPVVYSGCEYFARVDFGLKSLDDVGIRA